ELIGSRLQSVLFSDQIAFYETSLVGSRDKLLFLQELQIYLSSDVDACQLDLVPHLFALIPVDIFEVLFYGNPPVWIAHLKAPEVVVLKGFQRIFPYHKDTEFHAFTQQLFYIFISKIKGFGRVVPTKVSHLFHLNTFNHHYQLTPA